jgi:hypothetical protein
VKKIGNITQAFEQETRTISLENIVPLKALPADFNESREYQQILNSVKAVGLVEMPVVAINPENASSYILLDGHLRIQALKDLGKAEVDCLLSADDESYTYNNRIHHLAPAQKHKMIHGVIDCGVPEEMIAKTLGPEAPWVHQRSQILDGICRDAFAILHDTFCSPRAFKFLREMAPGRQVEAAELMVSQDNFSTVFVRALLAATPSDAMVRVRRRPIASADHARQLARMERELASLQTKIKSMEVTCTIHNLHLTIMRRYARALLENRRIFRWIDRNCPHYLAGLLAIAERDTSAREHG